MEIKLKILLLGNRGIIVNSHSQKLKLTGDFTRNLDLQHYQFSEISTFEFIIGRLEKTLSWIDKTG